MENKIKLSVIVPVYNTEEFLGSCLDSLYLQKYKNIEYILVDDGSTDGSLELCKKYAEKDNRFVVLSKENGGPSSARNLAISKARGEYLTFVDSDDFVSVDAYEKIAEYINLHKNPDVLVFGANLVPEYAPQYLWDKVNTRDIVYNNFTPDVLFNEVGARPFLWLQVVKKEIITENKIKMDESINLGEDQLFQIEFFPFAKNIVFVSDKFYNYRWTRDNSLMKKYGDNLTKKLKAHVGLIDRVFKTIYTEKYNDELKKEILVWSIFFMWGDLKNLLESDQSKIAGELVNVWNKYDYTKYYQQMNVWGQLRFDQIVLMGIADRDKRIEEFEKENQKLQEEVAKLKENCNYKKILKAHNKQKSLVNKFVLSLKTSGLKETLKKVKNKLKRK